MRDAEIKQEELLRTGLLSFYKDLDKEATAPALEPGDQLEGRYYLEAIAEWLGYSTWVAYLDSWAADPVATRKRLREAPID